MLIKGGLKVYYKQQQYVGQTSRQILNYPDGRAGEPAAQGGAHTEDGGNEWRQTSPGTWGEFILEAFFSPGSPKAPSLLPPPSEVPSGSFLSELDAASSMNLRGGKKQRRQRWRLRRRSEPISEGPPSHRGFYGGKPSKTTGKKQKNSLHKNVIIFIQRKRLTVFSLNFGGLFRKSCVETQADVCILISLQRFSILRKGLKWVN